MIFFLSFCSFETLWSRVSSLLSEAQPDSCPRSARRSDLLMISLPAVLSGSRHVAWPGAAFHAVTLSRRDCLTAVWSTQAPGCGMCTLSEGRWGMRRGRRGYSSRRRSSERSSGSRISFRVSRVVMFGVKWKVSDEGSRSLWWSSHGPHVTTWGL